MSAPTRSLSPFVVETRDTSYIAIAAITFGFLVLRYILWNTIIRKLALKYLPMYSPTGRTGGPFSTTEQDCLDKYSKYCWHSTCYILLVVWALKILFAEPWGFSLEKFADLPSMTDPVDEIKWFFWTQTGWYAHGLVELIMVERNRKDFPLMLVHHVISIVLTYGAYLWSVHRIGLLVTLCQDIADIVLYWAKIFQKTHSDMKTQKSFPEYVRGHTIGVACVGGAWLATRNIGLGTICWAVWNYCVLDEAWRWCLFLFLDLLLVLQIVWGIGIYFMVYQQIFSGHFHDMWHDRKKMLSPPTSPPDSPRGEKSSKKKR
eukprot:TRINITY_DN115158_c0_g1_i1.p1 TRINITY_DN115158_c0_g1~~TRINITY_DN115158_c0_g1_i1.p1  ORF type:complete len:317 (+),score=24.49 TRINITY_DN115158_c0_g1_i1:108-1058(+)